MPAHRTLSLRRCRTFRVCPTVVPTVAIVAAITVLIVAAGAASAASVSDELKQWHTVTLTFDGPATSETATPNPFLDYRLDVTFAHADGTTYIVPGYYAADGDAANTGASSGNKWRVHFAPDRIGAWTWSASFKQGGNVAANGGGSSAGFFDGQSGSVNIAPTDKSAPDLRARGRLDYVGKRYLRFAGTGEYMLKQGADAPENLLAYADFDGPFKTDGVKDNLIKTWSPHVQDWRPGDPTWAGGKGKGLIGAINYLASEGLNVFSFLTMNIGGDDRNVFPYLDYNERVRLDVSRLDQWEIVFEHGARMGMFLHFKTQETENELLLDGGNLGTQRKLYYRELIARFAHHPALNWNLGEEINDAITAQKKAWAQYFYDTDPYHHHIVIHNGSNHYDLLGPGSKLTGFSLQTNQADFSRVHGQVKNYLDRSAAAGKIWAVACDEPGDASHALRPDNDAGNSHEDGRKNGVWGTFMAGGWGNEWYFGYAHAESDLTLQDFRSRDNWWDYCRYAMQFFNDNGVPFWEMTPDDTKVNATDAYCMYKPGEAYVVYLKNGGDKQLDLTGVAGTFKVEWFDPRNGGALQQGTVATVQGGAPVNLGLAPNNTNADWAVLVTRTTDTPLEAPSVVIIDPNPGDAFDAPASFTVNATAADVDGTVTQVELFVNGVSVGVRTSGYAWDLSSLTPGLYTLRAVATDNDGLTGQHTITVTVNDTNPVTLAVVRFVLVNADTDADLRELHDGDTINLREVGTSLSVRAETVGPAESVRFAYDGASNFQTESVEPYALKGDTNGDYKPWTPTLGAHVLTGTPFTADSAKGDAGAALTIHFNVVDQVPLVPPTVVFVAPSGGDAFDAPANITVDVSAADSDGTVTQVELFVNGASAGVRTSGYSWDLSNLSAGTYALRVVATDNDGLTGEDTVSITINAPPTPTLAVVRFVLVNADTDADIGELHDGDTINLRVVGTSLSVRAETVGPAESVRFAYDGVSNYQTENIEPYAIRGDTSGDYNAWTPTLGQHTLTGTPYDADKASGKAGDALTVTFNVIDEAPAPTFAVTKFVLVNADTDADLRELTGGDVINLAVDGRNLSVRAEAVGPVESVRFALDGNSNFQTENVPVYALAGNSGSDYNAWTPSVGSHTLAATPYDANRAGGNAGDALTVSFTVVDTPVAPLTVAVTDDAYLENGTRFDNDYLKVEHSASVQRVAYLKVKVTGSAGRDTLLALLNLTTTGDEGSGTFHVHLGSHSNWTESTLTAANAPEPTTLINTQIGTMLIGSVLSFDVSSAIHGDGDYTFIVTMDEGPSSEDVWFGSNKAASPPRLDLTLKP